MKHPVLILLLFISVASCETKTETHQWNLNETIGWKPDVDLTVLYVKWNGLQQDTILLQDKRALDSSILEALQTDRLGELTGNDSAAETNLHFVVAKDYKKALKAIIEVAKAHNAEEKVEVIKRDYEADDKWKDKIVFPQPK